MIINLQILNYNIKKFNYTIKRRSFAGVEDWFKNFVDSWLTVSDETIKSRIENIIKFENVLKKFYYFFFLFIFISI